VLANSVGGLNAAGGDSDSNFLYCFGAALEHGATIPSRVEVPQRKTDIAILLLGGHNMSLPVSIAKWEGLAPQPDRGNAFRERGATAGRRTTPTTSIPFIREIEPGQRSVSQLLVLKGDQSMDRGSVAAPPIIEGAFEGSWHEGLSRPEKSLKGGRGNEDNQLFAVAIALTSVCIHAENQQYWRAGSSQSVHRHFCHRPVGTFLTVDHSDTSCVCSLHSRRVGFRRRNRRPF